MFAQLFDPGVCDARPLDSALPENDPRFLPLSDREVTLHAGTDRILGVVYLNVEGEDGSSDAVSFEWGAPHPDHLTIHIESTFLPAYPRFPFVDLVESGGVFTFHQCTAVYDPPGDRTHVIEAIPNFAGSGLTEGTPFRLFSLSPKESEGFAPVGGRTYVHANNEFVPEANAYVFGQGLHYSGQGGPVATVTDLASGKQIPAVRTASGYECIFVAVPLSIDFSTSSVRVLDVVIGNTAQGLVITQRRSYRRCFLHGHSRWDQGWVHRGIHRES